METKLLDRITKSLNTEPPIANSLDEALDRIIPLIRPWSEDLRELGNYLGRHWIELRDDETFHELVLHIFNEEGEYLKSTDGELTLGRWRFMVNKLFVGPRVAVEDSEIDEGTGQVFELAFLDREFFILRRYGNPRKFERRYFVLVIEPIARKVEWREAMDFLYNKYRNNNSFYITITFIVLLIVLIVLLLS
ncbi:MAG: hypothetical protein HUU01_03395 [Saprospiraceae bacterium]|nr:hypothetical protein [Saprospiraceae bacterium]